MQDDNKNLARRWFEEVWNQGRENSIEELLCEDGEGFGLADAGTVVHGAAELKPLVRNMRYAFPDLPISIEDMVSEADKVAFASM